MNMKRFKLLAITGAGLVILAVLAGCKSMTVVSIDTVTGPERVRQYRSISPNDIKVMATYKDGSQKPVGVMQSNIIFDSSKAGPQTVNLTTQGGGHSASFETEVMALTGITVASPPKPNILKLGGFNKSWPGLEIQASWDQMGSEKINTADCVFTGLDIDEAGRQTVTANWRGAKTAFDVEVVALQSIRVETPPSTISTNEQGRSRFVGLKVMGTWPGLPEEEISYDLLNFRGYDSAKTGIQIITVVYGDKTATFNFEAPSN